MKISDCLLLLVENELKTYEILEYLGKLVELDYVEVEGLTYKLTLKGKKKVEIIKKVVK